MLSLDALLNALDPASQKTQRRSALLIRVLVIGVVVAMTLVFLAVAAYAIWHGWETADWGDVGLSATSSSFPLVIVAIITVFGVLGSAGRLNQRTTNPEQLAEGARVLREAAQAGDERIAPLATLQPALLVPEDIPVGPFQIGPLKRPGTMGQSNRQQNSVLTMLIIVPFLFMCAFLPALISLPFTDFGILTNSGFPTYALYGTAAFIALIFVVAIGAATISIVRVVRGRRFSVMVDDQGVSWMPKGRGASRVQLRWDQVSSLSRIGGTFNVEAPQQSSYVLEGPEASLVWMIGPTSGPDEFAASEALLRLAVTKAGKPLRDLTGISRELIMAGRNALRLWATRVPAGTLERARPSGPLLGMQLARPARRKRGRIIGAILIALAFLLLVGGTFGTQSYLQQYQPRYFASLPARLHAGHTLFQDSLTASDSLWPVQVPTSNDVRGYGYTPQGYQLSGSQPGDSLWAYAPGTYTDAAVEVTAYQTGTPSTNGNDGIGLVLHTDEGANNFMIVDLFTAGRWAIWSYHYVDANPDDNWSYLGSGFNSVINAGQGGTNRLLVVMRGGLYLIYVNDHLVTTFSDRYGFDHLPTSGRVGIYLNDTGMVGTFTNFAIYPVKSQPALAYV